MGIIGNDMGGIKYEYWVNFWEVLEGIIGRILSTLGSDLPCIASILFNNTGKNS